MLGAIIGDIVGVPYEFFGNPRRKDFGPLFIGRSEFSDDTIMTVAVAKALLLTPAMEEKAFKSTLVNQMQYLGRKYPDVSWGCRFGQWLESYEPKPYGSFGNGSAMRVSPIGWYFDSLEETLNVAKWSAEVTHNHPEGVKGAQVVAQIIFYARNGCSKKWIKEEIQRNYGYDLSRKCDDIRKTYQFDESCQGTVPEAITAFMEGNSFEDVLRTAVSLGGDCDTLTDIACAMAEAVYPIPEKIRQEAIRRLPVEFVDVIDEFNAKLNR